MKINVDAFTADDQALFIRAVEGEVRIFERPDITEIHLLAKGLQEVA